MRRIAPIVVGLLLIAACGTETPVRPEPKTKVLILGFDGADLDVIEPMNRRGELPAFARVIREGASGKLQSITPLLSPIIWTTIATGKMPDKHGITDFVVPDEAKAGKTRGVTSRHRRVRALWNIVSDLGGRVGVVGWMATAPAERVNGYIVSDRVGLLSYDYGRREDEVRRKKVYPPELGARIEKLAVRGEDITYEDVSRFLHVSKEEFDASYRRDHHPQNRVNNMRLNLATAETYRRSGIELWKTEKPHFSAIYFELVDATCHLFMPYTAPRMPHVDETDHEKYRDAVAEAYRYSDRTLAQAMEMADEDTVILVLSDHGFRSGGRRLRKGSDFHDRDAARWHRPYGIFMAWGKGVRPGERVKGARVIDIAPTVLGLLGYPLAEDMPGVFLEDAFTVRPTGETVKTFEGPGKAGEGVTTAEEEEEEANLAKLRALGYVGSGSDQTASGHMNLGFSLMSQERHEEALREFQKALVMAPGRADVHLSIGDAWQALGNLEKAAQSYRTATRLGSGTAQPEMRLASALYLLDRRAEALSVIREAAAKDPEDAQIQLLLGHFLLKNGQRTEAAGAFRAAVALEPDLVQARKELGILLLKQQRFAEAEKHFLAAVELRPDFRVAWNNLCVTRLRRAPLLTDPLEREKCLDLALATMNETIERFPDYAKPYLNRAYLHVLRSQNEQALRDVEKALEIDPGYVEALALHRRLAGN